MSGCIIAIDTVDLHSSVHVDPYRIESFQRIWSTVCQQLVCLLLFYILPTSMVISGWVLTFDCTRSWWLYSAAKHHDWISHSVTLSWHWAYQSLPYHIIMPSVWLGSNKYQFLNRRLDSTRVRTHKDRIPIAPKMGDRCSTHSAIPFGHCGSCWCR